MKWIKSIRFRFALWTTALILAFLAAFGGFVYINLSLSLHTAIDNSLSLSAAQTAASLNVDNGRILAPEPIAADETGAEAFNANGLTLLVFARDGSLLQSAGAYRQVRLPQMPENSSGSFSTLSVNGVSLRIYTLPVLDNNQVVGWVQSMQSLESVQATLNRLLLALLLGGGLLTLLAGFAGYFLVARALTPIDRITSAARKISTADLSARLNLPDTGDEISRLAGTFDGMLSRLESGFQRERQFTADASHELRTPLTAMQAILSVIREGERPPAEYLQALDDLAEETSRMRGLVEDLLRLARGEGGLTLHPEPLDLSTLLADVADSLRPLAEAKGLSLTCSLPPALPITADMDALIRLFINLLDNAIKYTEKGGVTLTAQVESGQVMVEIRDTGIGIPPEHLPHIFERFYRVESARSTAGAGLGLAIAEQIARAHRGKISVESVPGAGTTFGVLLPKNPGIK